MPHFPLMERAPNNSVSSSQTFELQEQQIVSAQSQQVVPVQGIQAPPVTPLPGEAAALATQYAQAVQDEEPMVN